MAAKKKAKPRKRAAAAKAGGDAATAAAQNPDLLDMEQAIALLRTTRATFYRWLRSGKVKGMKVGRQWRFDRAEIERFLRGEEPRIETPVGMEPLMRVLGGKVRQLLGKEPSPTGHTDVVRTVNLMILHAAAARASDIHIAPHIREDRSGQARGVLRLRVDGILHTAAEFDIRLLPAVVDRWKTMAACDLHEKILPQDGRIMVDLAEPDRRLDIRVSFLPSALGETVTGRILDPDLGTQFLSLDRIRFRPRDREKILRWIKAPFGVIVVTGPTGCGKTSTMYACLKEIARPEIKIVTIEDPVEILLPWAVQVHLRVRQKVTFLSSMRAALRSDPDVVMVGELRDPESVVFAQQIALTGHLVLTALHVEEAAKALVRLAEVGGDAAMVGESTRLVVAQRLVRLLCPECARDAQPAGHLLDRARDLATRGGESFEDMPMRFKEPVGCPHCGQLGFRGREALGEALEVTPEVAAALRRGASADEIRALAVGQGMVTLAADGVRRAAQGRTTLDEVFRVLGLR